MKYREKLGYIALGGFLMLVGMLAAGSFLPLGAQSGSDIYYRKISCGALEVVRPDGMPLISIGIGETGGRISVKSERQFLGKSRHFPSMVTMEVDKHGGLLVVSDEQGKGKAKMEVDENGNGAVAVWRGGWFTQGDWKDAFGSNEGYK